jgi:hypothetical protein
VEYGGGTQTRAVRDLAAGAGFTEVRILKDLAGLDRVLQAG